MPVSDGISTQDISVVGQIHLPKPAIGSDLIVNNEANINYGIVVPNRLSIYVERFIDGVREDGCELPMQSKESIEGLVTAYFGRVQWTTGKTDTAAYGLAYAPLVPINGSRPREIHVMPCSSIDYILPLGRSP